MNRELEVPGAVESTPRVRPRRRAWTAGRQVRRERAIPESWIPIGNSIRPSEVYARTLNRSRPFPCSSIFVTSNFAICRILRERQFSSEATFSEDAGRKKPRRLSRKAPAILISYVGGDHGSSKEVRRWPRPVFRRARRPALARRPPTRWRHGHPAATGSTWRGVSSRVRLRRPGRAP